MLCLSRIVLSPETWPKKQNRTIVCHFETRSLLASLLAPALSVQLGSRKLGQKHGRPARAPRMRHEKSRPIGFLHRSRNSYCFQGQERPAELLWRSRLLMRLAFAERNDIHRPPSLPLFSL